MALDVSSVSTGWAVVEDGKLLPKAHGLIIMKQKLHGERLLFFEDEVSKLIEKHKPDHLFIEDIYKGPSIRTFKVLSYYHGTIHRICFKHFKDNPGYLGASTIRKILGADNDINLLPSKREQLITGKSSKEITFDFIKKKFKLKSFTFNKDNDTTDAIALALGAYLSLGDNYAEPAQRTKRKPKRKRKGSKAGLPKTRKKVSS